MWIFRLVHIIAFVWLQNHRNVLGHPTTGATISGCPDVCDCLSIYERVNCTFRELKTVPQGTFENAKSLYLNDNELVQLQNHTFDGFTNVNDLQLQRNRIKHIATGTFEKLVLDALDLSDNQITTISHVEMTVWVRLVLDRNPIVLEENTPGPIMKQDVQIVSLMECGLSRLSRNFLSAFPGTRHVALSRNVINSFAGVFQDLTLLEVLDLSENNISKVEGADVLAVPSTNWNLNLSRNPLQNLDLDSVDVLQWVAALDISDTPLVCECLHADIFWLAASRRMTLVDDCEGSPSCGFKITANSATGCGSGAECVAPEFCCSDGECSKDEKCTDLTLMIKLGGYMIVGLLLGSSVFFCKMHCEDKSR